MSAHVRQAAPPGGVGRGARSSDEGGAREACTGRAAGGGFKTAAAPTRARRASESEAAPHGREAVRRLASLKGAAGVRCARTDSERLGARGSARPWVSDDRRPRRLTPCRETGAVRPGLFVGGVGRSRATRFSWIRWMVSRLVASVLVQASACSGRRSHASASGERVRRVALHTMADSRGRSRDGILFSSSSLRPQIGVSNGRTSRFGGSRPWLGRGVETGRTVDS